MIQIEMVPSSIKIICISFLISMRFLNFIIKILSIFFLQEIRFNPVSNNRGSIFSNHGMHKSVISMLSELIWHLFVVFPSWVAYSPLWEFVIISRLLLSFLFRFFSFFWLLILVFILSFFLSFFLSFLFVLN